MRVLACMLLSIDVCICQRTFAMNSDTPSDDNTILADAQSLVGDVYSRVINSNTIIDCETYVYGMFVYSNK